MMYLMFMFTINIGGAFIDFFDQFFGAVFVDGFKALLQKRGSPNGSICCWPTASAAALNRGHVYSDYRLSVSFSFHA